MTRVGTLVRTSCAAGLAATVVAAAAAIAAPPVDAKTSTVTTETPFGSIGVVEVVGPQKGKCVDIPVVIDVENAKRAADSLPIQVDIQDSANKLVAVTVWDPAPQSIKARKYHLKMKACGKPHTYVAPTTGQGYNVITWDPRGEFSSGGTLNLDDMHLHEIYEFIRRSQATT